MLRKTTLFILCMAAAFSIMITGWIYLISKDYKSNGVDTMEPVQKQFSASGIWQAPANPHSTEAVYAEKYRPQYHYSPKEGWLNDPNGLVYYEGEYHLFYQNHPYSKQWGPMHWGHAVSEDLLHWEELPIAMYPDELGMIFSGSVVVDWQDTSGFFNGSSGLTAIFTHHTEEGQAQSVAYSKDKGRTWTKYEGNPVLPNFGEEGFRDPKVFWHEPTQRWVMIVAGGKVRFYSSSNFKQWALMSENDIWTECPDFFELAVDGNPEKKKWVLNLGGREYIIGQFDGERFIPETAALPLNYGPDSYAAQTFSDMPEADGRRVMINWMMNWEYAAALGDVTDPWNGAMTIPHELSLRTYFEGIRLVQSPVKELRSLRKQHARFENEDIAENSNLLDAIHGGLLELVAEIELDTAAEFGFKVRQGDGEKTVIGYDVSNGELFVDRSSAGKVVTGKFSAPLYPENKRVKMQIFIDSSSVEVFGNEGKGIITSLIFPDPASDKLEIYANNGNVRLVSLDIYELKPVWDIAGTKQADTAMEEQ